MSSLVISGFNSGETPSLLLLMRPDCIWYYISQYNLNHTDQDCHAYILHLISNARDLLFPGGPSRWHASQDFKHCKYWRDWRSLTRRVSYLFKNLQATSRTSRKKSRPWELSEVSFLQQKSSLFLKRQRVVVLWGRLLRKEMHPKLRSILLL